MSLIIQQFGSHPPGSFAVVHAALDLDDETGLASQVAVKQLHSVEELSALPLRPGCKASAVEIVHFCRGIFKHERRLWTSLPPHPNVVRARRADRFAGQPVLVLDYVHGASLLELVTPAEGLSYPIAPLDVLHLLQEIGNALALLHDEADILHGDVSPANILYDGLDRVVLADFGFALSSETERNSSRIDDAQALPFERYAEPPEETRGSQPSPAGDVWRLGLACLQALRGYELQDKELQALRRGEGAFLVEACSKLVPGESALAAALAGFLRRLVDPDLEKRPSSGLSLLRQLEADEALLRGGAILERRTTMRAALRSLIRRPDSNAKAALEQLRELEDGLFRIRSSAHHLSCNLPEDHTLLAAAGWAGYRATADDRLAARAARDAARSATAYDGDARVIDLLIAAQIRDGKRNAENLVARASRQRRRLEIFGSALAAAALRKLVVSLESVADDGANQARREAEHSRRVLAQYEEAELSFYRDLEMAGSSPEFLFS